MSSANRDNFTSSFPLWMPLISFSLLVALSETSCRIEMARTDILVLFLILRAFSLSPLSMMFHPSCAQLCLTLFRSHGLEPTRLLCPWDFPGRILEGVVISFSRGSSQPRDQIRVSCIAGRLSTHSATREAFTIPNYHVAAYLFCSVGWQFHLNSHIEQSFFFFLLFKCLLVYNLLVA